jgi:hypothetical protein
MSIDEVLGRLDPMTRDVLSQPRFRFATPESFGVFGGKIVYSERRPLVTQNSFGHYEVNCAEYSTRADHWDEEAKFSLRAFREALTAQRATSIALQRGDCLALSNVRGLHSRDAVTGPRHLKRAYFRDRMDHLRTASSQEPQGNVFSCEDFILL